MSKQHDSRLCQVCQYHVVSFECKGCKRLLCTPCLVEVAGGRLLCPKCSEPVAQFRQVR